MGSTGVLDVAKKRSESRRFNMLVRMDDEIIGKAKKVAALRGVSLAEYLAGILGPVVDRDLMREAKKLAGGSDQ